MPFIDNENEQQQGLPAAAAILDAPSAVAQRDTGGGFRQAQAAKFDGIGGFLAGKQANAAQSAQPPAARSAQPAGQPQAPAADTASAPSQAGIQQTSKPVSTQPAAPMPSRAFIEDESSQSQLHKFLFGAGGKKSSWSI